MIGPLQVPDPGPIAAPAASGPLTVSNDFSFSDTDVSDTHSVTAQFNASASDVGAPLGSFDASEQNDTVNGGGGVVHWEYQVDASTVNTLPAGTVRHEVFDVVVSDGQGGSATHQVTITINGPENNPPVIQNVGGGPPEVVAEDGSVLLQAGPTAAVTDVDSDTLKLTVHVSHGTLTPTTAILDAITGGTLIAIDSDGSDGALVVSGSASAITAAIQAGITYSPAANYNGSDVLEVGVDDGHGGTTSASVTITVNAVNDAPVASGQCDAGGDQRGCGGAGRSDGEFAVWRQLLRCHGPGQRRLDRQYLRRDRDQQLHGGCEQGRLAVLEQWRQQLDGAGLATTAAAITLNASDLLRFVPAANYNGAATALSANLIESGQAITSGATLDLTGATGGRRISLRPRWRCPRPSMR